MYLLILLHLRRHLDRVGLPVLRQQNTCNDKALGGWVDPMCANHVASCNFLDDKCTWSYSFLCFRASSSIRLSMLANRRTSSSFPESKTEPCIGVENTTTAESHHRESTPQEHFAYTLGQMKDSRTILGTVFFSASH